MAVIRKRSLAKHHLRGRTSKSCCQSELVDMKIQEVAEGKFCQNPLHAVVSSSSSGSDHQLSLSPLLVSESCSSEVAVVAGPTQPPTPC